MSRRLWAGLAQRFLRARGRRRAGPFEKGKHVASLLRQCRPRLCETSSSEIPSRSLRHIQAAGSRADEWAFIKGRSGGVSVRKVQTENTEEIPSNKDNGARRRNACSESPDEECRTRRQEIKPPRPQLAQR